MKLIKWQELAALRLFRQMVVLGAAFVLLLFVIIPFMCLNKLDEEQKLQQQTVFLEQKTAAIRTAQERYGDLENVTTLLTKQQNELAAYYLTSANTAGLPDCLLNKAAKAQVSILDMGVLPKEDGVIAYCLTVGGRYETILEFIKQLENTPPFVMIFELDIKPCRQAELDELEAQLTLQVFSQP